MGCRFHQPKKINAYLWLYILLSFISSATAACYDPDGDIESNPIFQPCGNSMCCATNRTNPSGGNYANGYTADICLENGLCENKIHVTYGDDTTLVTLYYRDYCTSSNWTNGGNCLDVCTEQTNPGIGISNSTIVMTPCDGTANSSTWCCGTSSSCCGSDSAISIAQTLGSGLPTTTTTSSSIRTTIPTTAFTATAATTSQSPGSTSTSSSSPPPSTGLSGGAKAGIGAGVALGSIGIITIALALFILRRRRTSGGIQRRTPQPTITAAVSNNCSYVKPQENLHDPFEPVGEMPAFQRYELPGEHT